MPETPETEIDVEPISDEGIQRMRVALDAYHHPTHSEATCDDVCGGSHGRPYWGPDDMERLIARLDAAEARLGVVEEERDRLRAALEDLVTGRITSPIALAAAIRGDTKETDDG